MHMTDENPNITSQKANSVAMMKKQSISQDILNIRPLLFHNIIN